MNKGELRDALINALMVQAELYRRLMDKEDDSEDDLEEALTESKKMSVKNWAPSPS